jgi:hypothetical protein
MCLDGRPALFINAMSGEEAAEVVRTVVRDTLFIGLPRDTC